MLKTFEEFKLLLINLKNKIDHGQEIDAQSFQEITILLSNPQYSSDTRKKIITAIDSQQQDSDVFSVQLLAQLDRIATNKFIDNVDFNLGLSYQPQNNNINNCHSYIFAGYPGAIRSNLQLIRSALDKISKEKEISYGSTNWNDLDTLDQQIYHIFNITEQRQDLFEELYSPLRLDACSLQVTLLKLKSHHLKSYVNDNPPPKLEDGVLVSDDIDDRLVDATLLQRRFEMEKQTDMIIRRCSTENHLCSAISNLAHSLKDHATFDKTTIFKQISNSLKSLLSLPYMYQYDRLLLLLRDVLLQLGRFDKTLVTVIVNIYLNLVDKTQQNEKGVGYSDYLFRIYYIKMVLLFPNLKANDIIPMSSKYFFAIIESDSFAELIKNLNKMFNAVTLDSDYIEITKHTLNFLPLENVSAQFRNVLALAIDAIQPSKTTTTLKLIDLNEIKHLMSILNDALLQEQNVKMVASASSASSSSSSTDSIMRMTNKPKYFLSDELRSRFKNLKLERDDFKSALIKSANLDDLNKLQEMWEKLHKELSSLVAKVGEYTKDPEWKEFKDSIQELKVLNKKLRDKAKKVVKIEAADQINDNSPRNNK